MKMNIIDFKMLKNIALVLFGYLIGLFLVEPITDINECNSFQTSYEYDRTDFNRLLAGDLHWWRR